MKVIAMGCVVIELKRDTNPQDVLQQLYHQTALSTNFGAILLALVDGQPRQLSLRQLLQEFLKFRTDLNRRYTNELEQAESRLHLVEGLLTALSELDEVISILRQASDGSTAKITLQSRFNLSEEQPDIRYATATPYRFGTAELAAGGGPTKSTNSAVAAVTK